jgi:hypothetical protein
MPYRPRQTRDMERAREAAASARAQGSSALDAALAQIGAAFNEAAAINGFKLRVERLLRLGSEHPALRARYGARAAMLMGRNLDAAIGAIERRWRDERKAFQIACALGRGSRLSLEVLRELRLILRLMRRRHMHAEFKTIVAALCSDAFAMAAE